ncbi:MAG: hypothetical protein HC796_11790 [Synechococcaceae cyanobacterium RL_1_2]|nr:hypothetical protein [Synechococcaceae cyanobacterium RL_1_2]
MTRQNLQNFQEKITIYNNDNKIFFLGLPSGKKQVKIYDISGKLFDG